MLSSFVHANIRADLGVLRYIFISPQAHRVHHSPAVASWIQSGITALLMVLFFFFTAVSVPDAAGKLVNTPALVPYVNAYGLLALIGTAMILIVQTICSAAVIWYFAA